MKAIIILVLILLPAFSIAKNTGSVSALEIKNVTMFSENESISPEYKGLTEINFKSNIEWSNEGNCYNKTVLIRNADKHIVSLVLASKVGAVPVKIYADDAIKVGNVCYLRAIVAI